MAKKDDMPLRITPAPEPAIKILTDEERRNLRLYFGEVALLYAVMVDRAGSERFLKEKVLPEGMEVTSRRIHLEWLKSARVWERMMPLDREVMMMADGHWEWDLIHRVGLAMEPLRLLRWILRIDFYLPVVGQQLKGDFALAHELVMLPQKTLEGKEMIDWAGMETGRDAARSFFQRCLAEAISRGYYDPENQAATQWGNEISKAMSGQQELDLVLGDKLVSEASREELLWAISISERRQTFLSWAMTLLETGRAPEGTFPAVVHASEG